MPFFADVAPVGGVEALVRFVGGGGYAEDFEIVGDLPAASVAVGGDFVAVAHFGAGMRWGVVDCWAWCGMEEGDCCVRCGVYTLRGMAVTVDSLMNADIEAPSRTPL